MSSSQPCGDSRWRDEIHARINPKPSLCPGGLVLAIVLHGIFNLICGTPIGAMALLVFVFLAWRMVLTRTSMPCVIHARSQVTWLE